jgi:hypothetical protein
MNSSLCIEISSSCLTDLFVSEISRASLVPLAQYRRLTSGSNRTREILRSLFWSGRRVPGDVPSRLRRQQREWILSRRVSLRQGLKPMLCTSGLCIQNQADCLSSSRRETPPNPVPPLLVFAMISGAPRMARSPPQSRSVPARHPDLQGE